MPRLTFDYDGTPDEHEPIPPIAPTDYDFQVVGADLKMSKSGKGQNLCLVHKITEDQGEESGKQVWDYLPTWLDFSQVNIKRFCKSVGYVPSPDGLDTEEIVGLFGRFTIKNVPYTPEATEENPDPETIMTNKVQDYLFTE